MTSLLPVLLIFEPYSMLAVRTQELTSDLEMLVVLRACRSLICLRGHATVEDRIRCGKSTGFGRFPSRDFGINAVWLELSLAAIDLLAWTRVLLLDGELATAEPKKLRYRLLHVAACLTRGGRRLRLRISATWPWRHELATAFNRLAALPRPAG